jgi:hypothetical protein
MPRTSESFDKDLAVLVTTEGTALNDAVTTVAQDVTEAAIDDLDLGGGGA